MPFNASAFLTNWHNPHPNRAQRRAAQLARRRQAAKAARAAYRYAAYTTVRGK